MTNPVQAQYDSLYANTNVTFGGGNPDLLVKQLPTLLANGSVLDVGGGDGRNALYLAEKGFDVTVIDLSAKGLEKLTKSAKEKGVSIKTAVKDVTTDLVQERYDAFIFSFVLHHIDSQQVREVIKRCQSLTPQNGIHIINTFGNEGGLYERAAKSGRFYPSKEELLQLYVDWDVISCTQKYTKTVAKDKNGKTMENIVHSLLARK